MVTRDYSYELRDGEITIATGTLDSVDPLEVGDMVEVVGVEATITAVEPLTGDMRLRLILAVAD